MTDRYCKRVTVRFRSPEVISRIEELPGGFTSMVIEAAMAAYLESETGNRLVELLIRRNKNQQKRPRTISEPPWQGLSPEQSEQKNVFIKHTTGDF